MAGQGFHCVGCHVNLVETISWSALGHRMAQKTFEKMVKKVSIAFAKDGGNQNTLKEQTLD